MVIGKEAIKDKQIILIRKNLSLDRAGVIFFDWHKEV
jgi:hypothetical protein